MTDILVLDLETAPLGECPPAPEEYLARVGSATKPETVERKRAENLAAWPGEWSKRASLDWRLGRIVCLGSALNGQVVVYQADEPAILRSWWALLADYPYAQVAGFGVKSFDWPWILGRSAVHGIAPSRILSTARYASSDLIDWQDVLSSYGGFSLTGWNLAAYAELFQLVHRPIGTGADVAGWVATGDQASIAAHCTADIQATWDLDQRCRPIWLGGGR